MLMGSIQHAISDPRTASLVPELGSGWQRLSKILSSLIGVLILKIGSGRIQKPRRNSFKLFNEMSIRVETSSSCIIYTQRQLGISEMLSTSRGVLGKES